MTKRKKQPVGGKTMFETLEGRELMSSVSLAHGLLSIHGQGNKANNIVVSVSGSKLHTEVNGSGQFFNLGDVKTLKITGGNKADKITVESDVKVRTIVNAKKGNDRISLGSADDTVIASAGNDTIFGGAGNDQLAGGDGDDLIAGNEGNDRLDGGGGKNSLSGGAGKDKILNGTVIDLAAPPAAPISSTATSKTKPAPAKAPKESATVTPAPIVITAPTIAPETGQTPAANTGPIGAVGGDTTTTPTDSNDTTTPATNGTAAVMTVLSSSVTAGNAVHVNAVSSNLGAGTALDATYAWDFGDTGSRYNNLVGFNAAHIYDRAGSYTVTLTVTDKAGQTSVTTSTVNIAADTRKTIYVSTSGNDSNTGLSEGQAIKSLTRAQQLMGSNTKILFHRGETWNTTGTALSIGFAGAQNNILIGAYGTGASPTFRFTGTARTQLINLKPGAVKDVTIQDVTFDSASVAVNGVADAVMASAVYAGGQNIAVRNCTFLNIGTGINGVSRPTGVLVQDNVAPLETGLRANFVWGEGSDYVVLGNKVANSTREHILRFADSGTDRVLVSDNDLSNLDRRSVDSLDFDKKTIVLQNGTYATIIGNTLTAGALDVSTETTATSSDGYMNRGVLDRWEYSVIENNNFHGSRIALLPNAAHVMLRNNVVSGSRDMNIAITGTDVLHTQRHVSDVYILNNTVISSSTANGSFIYATSGATGITVMNNLYLAPANTRPGIIKLADGNFDMFAVIDHNLWPANAVSYNTSSGFVSASSWNNVSQVGSDVFQNVVLPTTNMLATVAGQTFGALARAV